MTHGPEEHLEHAEHAKHAAHDPFDRRVSMTIAIVAAGLACVTMLSHRAHNATLLFQTQSNIAHTQASDKWSYYQSKKNRQYTYEVGDGLASILAKDEKASAAVLAKLRADWQEKSSTYKQDAKKIEAEELALEKEAEDYQKQSEHVHHRANRFDWGELAVELAVVLCSVAVLTKQPGYWYSGMVIAAIGAVVALSAFLVH